MRVRPRKGVADRPTQSQWGYMVAMVTVWAEGTVSILSVQKMSPLRSEWI